MKKLFSLLLVTLMLLSPFAMCVNAESVTEQAVQVKDTNKSKITSDLQAHLDTVDDDEYVPVYVWLNDYGEDMLYEVLSQRLGKTVTSDTEEAYIQDKIEVKEKLLSKGLENLAKTNEYKLQSMSQGKIDIRNLTGDTFKAQANLSGIMTDEEIDTCIESNMTSTEIIELSERNQFLSDYRQSRKTVNTAVNTTFYNSLDLDECRNVYLDPLLCRVTMECKKSYVDDMEGLSIVNNIGYKYDLGFVNEAIDIHQTVDESTESSVYGITSNGYHLTEEYQYIGAGVRVGVIEAGEETKFSYDTQNPHLAEKAITTNISISNDTISPHANKVLSIVAGKEKTVNGVTYRGIAPGANLYYTNLFCLEQIFPGESFSKALSWLVCEQNVFVINMSANIYFYVKLEDGTKIYNHDYHEPDQMVDYYVQKYRIVFVNSAGNDSNYVTSPGLAYNAITVGNCSYLNYGTGHYMNTSSNYEEQNDLTNKPDITAIGTQIHMCTGIANAPTIGNFGSGTSFAAPQVAGTVALMMQANPSLVGKPDTVKAMLLMSADQDAISDINNPLVDYPFEANQTKLFVAKIAREKSGFGLLNINSAINMAINCDTYYRYSFPSTEFYYPQTSFEYYFESGTTIEFGMVFEKFTDEILTNKYGTDLILQILDENNQAVMTSQCDINNVEIFKCQINQSGKYKFKIAFNTVDTTHIPEDEVRYLYVTLLFSCACVNKNAQVDDFEPAYHTITCDCGFSCKEYHHIVQKTKSYLYGVEVTYSVYYAPKKAGYSAPSDFDYFDFSYSISAPDGMIVHGLTIGTGNYVQQTPTGEIRNYNYEMIIEQNGQVSFIPITGVTITLDYFDQTVMLS